MVCRLDYRPFLFLIETLREYYFGEKCLTFYSPIQYPVESGAKRTYPQAGSALVMSMLADIDVMKRRRELVFFESSALGTI